MGNIQIYPLDAAPAPAPAPGVEVFLETNGTGDKVIAVLLTAEGRSARLVATQGLDVSIPPELLRDVDGQTKRFATGTEVEAGFEQARQTLLNTLRGGFAVKAQGNGDSFFGVGLASTGFSAGVSITPGALVPGPPNANALVLRAHAFGNFNLVSIFGNASIKAELSMTVEVAKGDLEALLDVKSPELPEFNLGLPKFNLPALSLVGIRLPCDIKFPRFKTPDLGLAFVWTTKPKIEIESNGNDLRITTPDKGAGNLKSGSSLIATITNAGLEFDGSNLNLNADVAPQSVTIPTKQITLGPIEIQIINWVITAKVSPHLVVTLELGRVEVLDAFDGSLYFAAEVGLEFSLSGINLTKVDLLHPTKLKLESLLSEALTLGGKEILRFFATFPLDPAREFGPILRELARMAKAVALWVAKQGGSVVEALAGVAEGIFEVLADFLRALLAAGQNCYEHFGIEIRLDPQSKALTDIILVPLKPTGAALPLKISGPGFDLENPFVGDPALAFHLTGKKWAGLVYRPASVNETRLVLSTDLWLKNGNGERPVSGLNKTTGATDPQNRLIKVKLNFKDQGATKGRGLAPIAISENGVKAIQLVGVLEGKRYTVNGKAAAQLILGDLGGLMPVTLRDVNGDVDARNFADKVLSLLPKVGPSSSGQIFDRLSQYVEIERVDSLHLNGTAKIGLKAKVKLGDGRGIETQLLLDLDYHNLSVSLEGGQQLTIKSEKPITSTIFGLNLIVTPNATKDCIQFDLAKESISLATGASAEITFPALSGGEGRGLVLRVDEFQLGRGGLDLEAIATDEPVRLGGVDVPFRFTGGRVSFKGSEFASGSITGAGQLPSELIGEANCSVSLTLGVENGAVVVQSASAKLERTGDSIECHSTKFRFTISELGIDFVRENGYHFYFLVTGTARILLESALTSTLRDVDIILNKAPLARDGRILMRAISFLRDFNPTKKGSLFGLFEYDVRAFAFYPSSNKFSGNPPAIGISGQAKFTEASDVVVPKIDFHEMLIAPGAPIPRVRFDGLTVGLRLSDLAEVEGTAIAVDGSLPSLYKPDTLPANVTASGFLARGRLNIKGWASMSAAMGFLKISDGTKSKHAMFFYLQANELTVPVPTPIGEIYLREVGFGLGFRYTLRGIADASKTDSPRELVRVLDEISRYQGSLDKFEAWTLTPDNNDLTLAMRAMFSLRRASAQGSYNREGERIVDNPVLFDAIAALRMDGTFLMSVRAYLCTNYEDWNSAKDAAFKNNPLLRGYLYLSVPRREFLARLISEPNGHIGEHPPLPEVIKVALKAVRYQSALYIRPGLFHMELGWPFGLGFSLGKPTDNFYLDLKGGLVNRYEDGGFLYGIAFRANGHASIGGQIGGENLGAAARAFVRFSIEGKFLSYISTHLTDSMLYGAFQLDVAIGIEVSAWLQFRIFRARIRLSLSFSFTLTVSVGLEIAILLDSGIAARAHVPVGIRVFGRSLCIGIGFTIGGGVLGEARARVARFMALGLSADVPSADAVAKPPSPEPPRAMRAVVADERIQREAKSAPANPTPPEREPNAQPPQGVEIGATDFWAILMPTSRSGKKGYLIQLVPMDDRAFEGAGLQNPPRQGFFAPPPVSTTTQEKGPFNTAGNPTHDYEIKGSLSKLYQLKSDGSEVSFASEFAQLRMEHEKVVHMEGSQEVCFGHFMGSLFTFFKVTEGNDKQLLQFGDPCPLKQAAPVKLAASLEESAQRLHEASLKRRSLNAYEQWEMEIREGRSSLIGHVGDSAMEIARSGSAAANQWKQSGVNEIDARDLALTFFVDSDDYADLFEGREDQPPIANFLLLKRVSNDVESKVECSIFVLNPPERMFEQSEPFFAPVADFEPRKGVVFDWDLEPTWGQATSTYDDPEFHLRKYLVTREVTAGGRTWVATFEAKRGDTLEIEKTEMTAHRARYQFIDGFSPESERAGVRSDPMPQSIRDLLLHRVIDLKAWDAEFDSDKPVEVKYTITPVDIAGTKGTPRPAEARIPRPVVYQEPPVEARLAVKYVGFNAGQSPALAMLIGYSTNGEFNPSGKIFELKVRKVDTLAAGPYGVEAASVSNSTPSQEFINSDQPEDKTFSLEFATGSAPRDIRVALTENNESSDSSNRQLYLTFTKGNLGEFLKALGIKPVPASATAVRLYLREQGSPGLSASAWISVAIQIQAETERAERKVDAVVDEFESPRDVVFLALENSLVDESSGRIVLTQPNPVSSLESFIDDPNSVIRGILDPARRSAVRLKWHARPRRVKIFESPNAQLADALSLIGGFDLFSYEVDGRTEDETLDYAEKAAEWLGSLHLQPSTMRGISPAEFGDMSKLHSAYPSDSLTVGGSEMRRRPWLSVANSVARWPDFLKRRSVMLDIDESVVASLLANGVPERLRISVGYRLSGEGDKTLPPNLVTGSASSEVSSEVSGSQTTKVRINQYVSTSGGEAVKKIRQALFELQFEGTVALEGNPEPKRFEDVDDETLRRVFVRVEAIDAVDGVEYVRAKVELPFDPHTSLHPVLADALDLIQYDHHEFVSRASANYKRFVVVLDSNPSYQTDTLDTFLDGSTEGRDPYGWGALRTLGLAVGFRLYEADTGIYITGPALLKRIQKALDIAKDRFVRRDGDQRVGPDFGSPFVDLLTRPWGLARLAGHDGGIGQAQDGDELVRDELLAVVQVSLRPTAEALLAPTKRAQPVFSFFRLKVPPKASVRRKADKVAYGVQFVLNSDSAQSARPINLPTEPDRAISLPGEEFLVRVVRPQGEQALAPKDLLEGSSQRNGTGAQPPAEGTDGVRYVSFEIDAVEIAPFEVYESMISSIDHSYRYFALENRGNADENNEPNGAEDIQLADQQVNGLRIRRFPKSEVPTPRIAGELVPGLLGRFDPLSDEEWRRVFFGQPDEKERTPFHEFKAWGERALKQLEVPVLEPMQNALAFKFAAWQERFMEHGAATLDAPLRKTGFSLGTVAEQSVWRTPADSHGMVSMFILAPSTYGTHRKYIVRPFGRYRSFIDAMSPEGASKQPSLANAFEKLVGGKPTSIERWAINTQIPRTERPARPGFLSASLIKPAQGESLLEFVLDRPVDGVLANANRVMESAQDFDATYVGFFREFPWRAWAENRKGRDRAEFQLGQLGKREALPGSFVNVQGISDAAALTELRKKVPEAWLGTTVLRVPALPYFYRIHALAYSAAGVVVSDPVVATVNEGAFKLEDPSKATLQPVAKPATYSVSRSSGEVKVILDLPLVRFADAMESESRRIWLPIVSGLEMATFCLPDPTVVYRVAIETRVDSAVAMSPEIDALPQSEPTFDPAAQRYTQGHYALLQLGERLTLDPVSTTVVEADAKEAPANVWRLQINTKTGKKLDPADVVPTMDPAWIRGLRELRFELDEKDLWLPWFAIAPRGEATYTVVRPADGATAQEWEKFTAEIVAWNTHFKGLPGIEPVKTELKKILPLTTRDHWKAAFPADPAQLEIKSPSQWLGIPLPHYGSQFVRVQFGVVLAWPTITNLPRWTEIRRALRKHLRSSNWEELVAELRRCRVAQDAKDAYAGIAPYRSTISATDAPLVSSFFRNPIKPAPALDALVEVGGTITSDAQLKEKIENLMIALERHDHTAQIIEQLDRLNIPPNAGATVFSGTLLLPIRAALDKSVVALAKNLGLKVSPNAKFLVLWQPPTDQELDLLAQDVQALFIEAAEAQLFGQYRHLVIVAAKGDQQLQLTLSRKTK